MISAKTNFASLGSATKRKQNHTRIFLPITKYIRLKRRIVALLCSEKVLCVLIASFFRECIFLLIKTTLLMFSTRAMLLLIECKYKILSKQSHYQKLVSVPDEKPSKQSNGNAVDVEIRELKSKVTISSFIPYFPGLYQIDCQNISCILPL